MENTIIYLIGNPGVGKQTIAKKIAEKDKNSTVVDNHLYTNAIFAISKDFENPKHELYRLKIRDVVYDAIRDLCPTKQSFIFTNVVYKGEEDICITPIDKLAKDRKATFIPILLECDKDENKKRIVNPFRAKNLKTTNPDVLDNIIPPEITHPNLLKLNVTNLSADEVASCIIEYSKKLSKKRSLNITPKNNGGNDI